MLNSASTPQGGRPSTRKKAQSYVVSTVGEVAAFFGVSVAAVNKWKAEDNPMPGSPGKYDLSAIARWKLTRTSRKAKLNDPMRDMEYRLKEITAKQKELDYEMQKGGLLELTDVERWAAMALIETREMVMSLPELLATSSPPEFRDFVREESDRHCRDVLTMLRHKLETTEIDSVNKDHNAE